MSLLIRDSFFFLFNCGRVIVWYPLWMYSIKRIFLLSLFGMKGTTAHNIQMIFIGFLVVKCHYPYLSAFFNYSSLPPKKNLKPPRNANWIFAEVSLVKLLGTISPLQGKCSVFHKEIVEERSRARVMVKHLLFFFKIYFIWKAEL